MKRVAVLGSTGSIGRNVLEVVGGLDGQFEIVALGARSNADLLMEQAREWPDALVATTSSSAYARMKQEGDIGARLVPEGPGALEQLVADSAPDLLVNAVVGFAGLQPTMAAIERGISVAIANKETVITGGHIVIEAARAHGASLIPIDSEHVAISQCLRGERREDVNKVIITASGGALRDRSVSELGAVTVEDVLSHPTWKMGSKITVDSATLVNKGLEVIEAHWLFDLKYEEIEVVIHPQSIVHSFVRFVDGSIMAQMGEPDMRIAILYALSYPNRSKSQLGCDITSFPELSFEPLDARRYPCFGLVMDAARAGGNAPTVLNAANEVAVRSFLRGEISFVKVPVIIAEALAAIETRPVTSLDDIIEADRLARAWACERFSLEPSDHVC